MCLMQNYYAGDNVKWRNENKLERKLLGIVKTNSKKKKKVFEKGLPVTLTETIVKAANGTAATF